MKNNISVDGKTMRGNATATHKANHIVSAWCDTDGFCLGQEAVEEKSNEITAIPPMITVRNVLTAKRVFRRSTLPLTRKRCYPASSEPASVSALR